MKHKLLESVWTRTNLSLGGDLLKAVKSETRTIGGPNNNEQNYVTAELTNEPKERLTFHLQLRLAHQIVRTQIQQIVILLLENLANYKRSRLTGRRISEKDNRLNGRIQIMLLAFTSTCTLSTNA